jgi:Alternative complex III, ActD subunit
MDTAHTLPPASYGVMAEFETPAALVEAAKKTYAAGYRKLDTFSPFPIEEAWEAIGARDRRMSRIVLGGGIAGLLTGIGLQEWVHQIAYPINVAGKPLNSWPQFVPVCFELTILFASLAAVIGMIALNGLPMPYHPVFNVQRFADHASRDRFFLLVESADPKFDTQQTMDFLKGLNPAGVSEVEP